MKPELLKISAWGPFKEETAVDFRQLSMRGLFLITGPTGAGKTTIFDAISFALFGRVSGETREKDSVRSDFAGPDQKTFVELTFSHRNEEYQVFRNPRYLRPKKRRTKTSEYTVENENARLKLPDGRIIAGSVPVSQRLQEILGYDYRQFKQISMIAQGEFTRLLHATAAEKTRIFREIFDTGLFGRMEKHLRKQALMLEEQRNRAVEFCDSYIAELKLADEEWDKLTGSLPLHYGNIAQYLERSAAEDAKLLREAADNLTQLRDKRKKLQKVIAVRREYEKQVQEYEKAAARWEVHQQEAKEMKALFGELSLAARAENVRPFEVSFSMLKDRADSLRGREESLTAELRQGRGRMEALTEEYGRLPVIRAEQERLQKLAEKKEDEERLLAQLCEAEKRLTGRREAYLLKNEEMKARRSLYEAADERFRKASAGILALNLEDGSPCPVCGSLTHPAPAALPEGESLPDEQEVERLKLSFDQAREECGEIFGAIAGLKGESGLLKKSVEKLKKEFSGEKDSDKKAGELQRLKDDLAKKSALTAKEYEEQRLLTEGRKTLLKSVEEELQKVLGELMQARAVFQEERKKNGFSSEEDFEKAGRPKEYIKEKTKILEEYEKEGVRLKESMAFFKKKTSGKSPASTEELNAKDAELYRRERERDKLSGELKVRLEQKKRLLKVLRENMDRIGEIEKKYGIVKDLSNLTGGQNRLNLVFEQYVLASYFEEVLSAANLRMDRMSMGRYEMFRAPGVGDGRAKDNLEIQVLDHYTGKFRSVKTLSGGESFKAALSLALGLSDIIKNNSGGIEVDTLFIDEGFGALDSESLDQAVGCLAGLVENDRFIGIISHVGELRERIDRQIVVEKTKTGSNIRIVS